MSKRTVQVFESGQRMPHPNSNELLGRKGEVARERLALRDGFVEALAAYRRKDCQEAHAAFEGCLKIMSGDGPSKVFLGRVAQFCSAVPSPDRDGVWSLVEK